MFAYLKHIEGRDKCLVGKKKKERNMNSAIKQL